MHHTDPAQNEPIALEMKCYSDSGPNAPKNFFCARPAGKERDPHISQISSLELKLLRLNHKREEAEEQIVQMTGVSSSCDF